MVMGGILGTMAVASCSEKIDESNLYTFSGQTIIDYLRSNEELTDFVELSDAAGMSDRLAAYGTYTCFVPTNSAVETYIDSLYNDKTRFDHNKLCTDEGLSMVQRVLKSEKCDSLSKDIVESQITGNKKTSNDLYGGADITMMLGNTQTPKRQDTEILFDGISRVMEKDLEMENGIVHIVDHMFYRSSNLVTDEMTNMGVYKIWIEALKATGLDKVMTDKVRTDGIDWLDLDASGAVDYPTTCKVGYTVFAETDKVLQENGINSLADLVAYANSQYENCSGWYSYVNDNGIEISTGNDYTNQWNALNMFLRYHIVNYIVSSDKLVYSYNELQDLDVFEYYRTLLPYTMFKVTGAKTNKTISGLYINRQLTNPTLTTVAGNVNLNSSAYLEPNTVVDEGVQIAGGEVQSRQASNGYIHPLNKMLVYNSDVPNKVLNERMRFDVMSLLDESISNRFRGYTGEDLKSLFGRSENITSVRFPSGYFKNLVTYNGNTSNVTYLTKDHAVGKWGGYDCWSDYQGDELFISNCAFDFAIKLPPVPKDGTYEIRFGYTANGKRTVVQFYIGTSSDRSTMVPIDIPLNQNEDPKGTEIGWTNPTTDDDGTGAAVDKSMHNRGWMRGPHYYTHFKGGTGDTPRFFNVNTQMHVRRVVAKRNLSQGQEYWLRFKTALPEDLSKEFEMDYIELVPVHVYNNSTMTEDVL